MVLPPPGLFSLRAGVRAALLESQTTELIRAAQELLDGSRKKIIAHQERARVGSPDRP